MSDHVPTVTGEAVLTAPTVASPARRGWWLRLGSNFLIVSILAHVLFGVGATYLIVQTIQAKRKQNFAGQPTSPNAPMRVIEHKVQMQKKQQTMSAPAPMKRITTTSHTPVALPAMPAMPKLDSAVTPLAMAGMGGTAMGLGLGTGAASNASSGGGGGGLSLFGLRTGGAGLVGTFYDLKQTTTRQSTNMTPDQYGRIMVQFADGGFNTSLLGRFYKADRPVYATRFWIPIIDADQGPAAFQLQNLVQPKMWCVHYRGQVTPPESFTFHFVGAGDDIMMVRFNGRLVLERNWSAFTNWRAQANYDYPDLPHPNGGFAKGNAITVEAGKSYPIEVIIGEQPGGKSYAALLQEVDGATYDKDARGNPILPVFRMSADKPAASTPERPYPPHRDDGPVWKAEPAAAVGSTASN